MPTLLVVFHSQSGNTERLSAAVERGARRAAPTALEVVRKRALDASLEDLLTCDGSVFETAEYNGYMSGARKTSDPFYPAQDL